MAWAWKFSLALLQHSLMTLLGMAQESAKCKDHRQSLRGHTVLEAKEPNYQG